VGNDFCWSNIIKGIIAGEYGLLWSTLQETRANKHLTMEGQHTSGVGDDKGRDARRRAENASQQLPVENEERLLRKARELVRRGQESQDVKGHDNSRRRSAKRKKDDDDEEERRERHRRKKRDDDDDKRKKKKKREDMDRKKKGSRNRRHDDDDDKGRKEKKDRRRHRSDRNDDSNQPHKALSSSAQGIPDKSDLIQMGEPLSRAPDKLLNEEEDYFAYHEHFVVYLYREEKCTFDDLDSTAARQAFAHFVQRYNTGSLEAPYYDDVMPIPVVEECRSTRYKWSFQTSRQEAEVLQELQDGVRKQTKYHGLDR